MGSLSFQECCRLFAIDPKTLRQWLAQAQMSLQTHPKDARIKCLSDEQIQLLASFHGLALAPDLSPVRSSEQEKTPDTDLCLRLAHLEAQVATLQTQLADFTLQLLRERQQRTEERLLALEAERTCADPPSVSFSGAPSTMLHTTAALLFERVEAREPAPWPGVSAQIVHML